MNHRPRRPRRSACESIMDAAALALAESPNASMAAIAEAAGVGRATLYRHFPSREALIKALSLEAIRVMDEAVAPIFANYTDAETALRDMLEVLVPCGDRYHFLASEVQVTAEPEVASAMRRQLDELAAFVEQAKAEGVFARELPTAWIVNTVDSLIWTAWNTVHRGEVAVRQAAHLVFRTLVQGLGPGEPSWTAPARPASPPHSAHTSAGRSGSTVLPSQGRGSKE